MRWNLAYETKGQIGSASDEGYLDPLPQNALPERGLRGDLSDISMTWLFNLVDLVQNTGILHIYEPATAKGFKAFINKHPREAGRKELAYIAFKEGRLILAAKSDQLARLVSALYKAGKLTAEQSHMIRERSSEYPEKTLAMMLINANYVSQADIIHSIQQYMLEIVFDLMTWRHGQFFFEENATPSSEHITVLINLKDAIFEWEKREREAKLLEEELPDMDIALKFADAPRDKFRGIPLSMEEWCVISFVNPEHSIQQIAKACDMTDIQIRRIVYKLLQAGLVELARPTLRLDEEDFRCDRPISLPPTTKTTTVRGTYSKNREA